MGSVACSMIVIEIFGIAMAFMSFNVFVAAIALMGMGLSVEFTAHLAAAFSYARGPRQSRLGTAMAHTFPALIEGSMSTFLSILPMAFHPMPFAVKYLFGILAMVIAVGMLNGILIMPGLISIASPVFAFFQRGRELEVEHPPSQEMAKDAPTLLAKPPQVDDKLAVSV